MPDRKNKFPKKGKKGVLKGILCFLRNDGFVKSYNMPLRDTVTKNNLLIISIGYDLVI